MIEKSDVYNVITVITKKTFLSSLLFVHSICIKLEGWDIPENILIQINLLLASRIEQQGNICKIAFECICLFS